LELQLFKHPIFSAINLNISIAQFIMMITVFRAIYFQTTLDYTPSQAGLLTFVSTMPVLFLSTLGGYLSDKVSPKLPISLGYLFLIFSCLWFGWFSTPGLVGLLIPLVTFGMGLPFIFTPSYSSAMGSVPPQKLGVAFGIVGTLRYSAATLGLALIALFISSVEQKTHSAQPQVSAFSAVHFALGALLIATFLLVLIFYRRKSAHHLPEAPAEGWD
jgi:DHA2 family lincomycin resistance protein-like MFS transporter